MKTALLASAMLVLPGAAMATPPFVPALDASTAAAANSNSTATGSTASATSSYSGGSYGTMTRSGLPPPPPGMPPSIEPLSPSAPLLAKEAHAADLARTWRNGKDHATPGADGVVHYLFGSALPTMVCAPLQVSDLALQPGETVNQIHLGDTTRWKVTPALSGSGAGMVTHLIIKPTDAGLVSSMIVETDRRTYAVKLVSTQHEWIPLAAFDYPEDAEVAWEQYRAQVAYAQAAAAANPTSHTPEATAAAASASITRVMPAAAAPAPAVPRGGGSTPSGSGPLARGGYEITGDRPDWRPLRVFADQGKTYIQFPRDVTNGAAPVLVGLSGGDWFSGPDKQMINYRAWGSYYVVDHVIDRAELIEGVGSDQTAVKITRVAG